MEFFFFFPLQKNTVKLVQLINLIIFEIIIYRTSLTQINSLEMLDYEGREKVWRRILLRQMVAF